jgi:hypothetical protein
MRSLVKMTKERQIEKSKRLAIKRIKEGVIDLAVATLAADVEHIIKGYDVWDAEGNPVW